MILVLGRASNSATLSSYEGFQFCVKKIRLVATIILVPGRASKSATLSSDEVFTCCIQKMPRVALVIFVPERASNSATVSSYEGFKLCIQGMRLGPFLFIFCWSVSLSAALSFLPRSCFMEVGCAPLPKCYVILCSLNHGGDFQSFGFSNLEGFV